MKKMLITKILWVWCFVLPNDLKSQNVSISDSIENVNPMDVFKMWQNNDTIKVKYESSGCKYYAETIEFIKIEDTYIVNLVNKEDSLIAQKKLNLLKLEVLKDCLKRVLLKQRGETCLQNYSLTFFINSNLYSEYIENDDCRMNSFWEIKEIIFDIKN